MCAITNYDMFARLKVEVETKSSRGQAAPTQGLGKMKKLRRRPKRKPRSKSAAPEQSKTNRNKSGAKSDSEL
ncbi:hypothetical protein HF086_016643 [Spodoptera exigua]|uniref:Uncharacterized protein n=1 Tax=Spodoptera exigua TaxID=7107 RepID=A0A922MTW9_SPOEX|nr:hypothetical protein HF086_016643 [Spodoptera exigua]